MRVFNLSFKPCLESQFICLLAYSFQYHLQMLQLLRSNLRLLLSLNIVSQSRLIGSMEASLKISFFAWPGVCLQEKLSKPYSVSHPFRFLSMSESILIHCCNFSF